MKRRGFEQGAIMDMRSLAEIFRAHQYDDMPQEARALPPEKCEQAATIDMISTQLHELSERIHARDTEAAMHVAAVLHEELASLPMLRDRLWPVIEESLIQHTGERFDIAQAYGTQETASQSIETLLPTTAAQQKFASTSFMGALRHAAGSSVVRSLLMVIALQSAVRGNMGQAFAQEKPVASELVISEGTDQSRGISEKIVNTTAPNSQEHSIEQEPSPPPETRGQFLESLSSHTSFDKAQLFEQLQASIRFDPSSWGVSPSVDAVDIYEPGFPQISQEQIEAVARQEQETLWSALTLIGDPDRSSESIEFEERRVRAKKGKTQATRTHTLSVAEQQILWQRWITDYAASNDTIPAVSNLDAFCHEQPEAVQAIAKEVTKRMPKGFLVFTSGFRSPETQVDAIWKEAAQQGIAMDEYDQSSIDDILAVHKELKKKGAILALPGFSNHQRGTALDMAFFEEDEGEDRASPYWKLFPAMAERVKAWAESQPDFSVIIEPRNGAHGAIHVDASKAFVRNVHKTKAKHASASF